MRLTASQRANIRAYLWPTLLLGGALAMALVSSVARRDGQYYASAFLALLSLALAAVSSVALIPRLLSRIRLDFLDRLRFLRFTKRGLTFLLIVLIIAFSALNTGNNLLILVLAFLLSSLIASGFASNLALYGLKISLNTPPAIHARQNAVFFVTLKNLKRFFPSFALQLKGSSGRRRDPTETETSSFFVQEKRFPCVRAGEELRLDMRCEFQRRGIYPIEGFEVRTGFPFGLFSKGRELKAHGRIIVYPELRRMDRLFQSHPFLLGSIETRRKGLGSGLYNIRPYQGGDSTRYIHWKSTAKLAQLMVKDFVAEEETPLHLAFSTHLGDASPAALEKFETAVSYLATLGSHYRNSSQPFHFDSGEFSVQVNGKREDFEAFMEYLACVAPSPEPRLRPGGLPRPSILFAAGPQEAGEGVLLVDYLRL